MEKTHNSVYASSTLDFFLEKTQKLHKKTGFDYLSLTQQGKITASTRQSLVETIQKICSSQSASSTSEQLAVYYLDFFLSKKIIPTPSFLKLLTHICSSLALKYAESRQISFEDISKSTHNKYPVSLLKTTENYLLTVLNWEIDIVTPDEFIKYLIIESCPEYCEGRLGQLAVGFVKVGLRDYEVSRCPVSFVAIAAVLCGFGKMGLGEVADEWMRRVGKRCGVCEETVKNLSKSIGDKVNSNMN